MHKINLLIGIVVVLAALSVCARTSTDGQSLGGTTPPVALMADAHFANVYGDFKSAQFSGIPTPDGKSATIRTMHAQLTSTRLFNENYFALRAALDDVVAKGVRFVALPGDCTDDAQPMNINGIRDILNEYKATGLRFFIAPGNHDPNRPYDNDEAGKSDFLTARGAEQKVYATGYAACKAGDPTVTCTDQLMELGYESYITTFADFGFMPNEADLYWETPFSPSGQYTYAEAAEQAKLPNRQFEICAEGEGGIYKAAGEKALGAAYTNCSRIIDASYLVEPAKGLWLLAIDANVYVPNKSFDPNNPTSFKGFGGAGDAGWNKVLTHKKHLMDWITSVAARAKADGKRLVAFSHYPTMEFYANQTDAIEALFKPGAFQSDRVPEAATTAAVAATGLRWHVGGHMHSNGTNDFIDPISGNYFVNVQSPSLAVYGAAYKIATYTDQDTVDVQTVTLKKVPNFNQLFRYYETEHDYLHRSDASSSDIDKRWDRDILDAPTFGEFTYRYFGELVRLRLMNDYWPCEMKEAAMSLDASQMLVLSQLQTQVTLAQLQSHPSSDLPLSAVGCTAPGTPTSSVAVEQLATDWAAATAKAEQLATAANLTLADFAQVSAYAFYGDFHRTVYAGELALGDMTATQISVYRVLMGAFPATPAPIVTVDGKPSDQNTANTLFQNQFKKVFAIFKGLASAKPSNHFVIHLASKTLSNASSSEPSF